MVDRYLLRYFLAVLDRGSFSKAAIQLNVAQPSLSVGIAKLERLLGATLFHRSSQRVHLTTAGSRLAGHARRIEQEFNAAEAAFLDSERLRRMRLGVLSTYPTAQLAALVGSAKRMTDGEPLEIVPGNERELLQRLDRGQIEAALSIVRPGSVPHRHEALFTEGYALAMHVAHPLADRACILAEQLADNAMIVRRHCEVLTETSRHFTERGVRPFLAFRSTNDDQVLGLVQAGLGVTLMPQSYALAGVARPALEGFNLQRTIGLLYAGHADPAQFASSAIIRAIRARYPERALCGRPV